MKPDHLSLNTQYALLPLQGLPTVEKAKPRSLRLQLQHYWQQYKTRQQLAELSDTQLLDIGLTRDQVQVEVSKLFWQ